MNWTGEFFILLLLPDSPASSAVPAPSSVVVSVFLFPFAFIVIVFEHKEPEFSVLALLTSFIIFRSSSSFFL